MGSKFEVVEPNKVKITFEITPEKLEEGCQTAYKKSRGKINIPGFRKGKAPRKIIELNFGKDVFYEDAVNLVLPEIYENVIKELKIDSVSKPVIDIEEISEEKGAVLTAGVYTKPEVTIESKDYKGVKYEMFDDTVSEEEINKEIDKAREQNSRITPVTDRAVKDGDIVTVDFEGFQDGVAFAGGKSEDYELTIGSHTFIDTFEEQIIGKNIDEEFEVNVVFPEEYHSEELKGKPAMFNVKVKSVKYKELPEMDDDFAQDISEFDTLAEYKKSVEEKLKQNKEKEAVTKKENDILKAIVEKAVMDLPNIMIENQIDQMINDFANQLRMQGLPLDTYLQYMGQDLQSLRVAYAENAENQVRSRLVLEAIARNENFEVTDADFDEEIVRLSESNHMEKEKILSVLRDEDKEGLNLDIKVKKALDFVVESAVGE